MARGKEYIKKMNEYINSVLTGEREAGRLEIKTVERHVNDLKYAMEKGIFWDERAAMKALEFFSLLRHYKGKWAGAEFVLEGWQCFVVASIFGWKKAGGVRRFNVGYLEVSRKNGKTQLAAAIGLIMLLVDGEFGAEVYSAAVDKDQASICWSAAGTMIQQSPVLRKRTLVSKNLSWWRTRCLFSRHFRGTRITRTCLTRVVEYVTRFTLGQLLIFMTLSNRVWERGRNR